MIPVSRTTTEILKKTPFLLETLVAGLINTSALARKLQPQIERRQIRSVSIGSIVMALKRIAVQLQGQPVADQLVRSLDADLSIRSRLTLAVFAYSPSLFGIQKQILDSVIQQRAAFLTVCYGTSEATFIVSRHCEQILLELTRKEKCLDTRNNLSAITIRFLHETADTPGVYYRILKELAWADISFIEILSSGNELTIAFENGVVDRGFTVLKQLCS